MIQHQAVILDTIQDTENAVQHLAEARKLKNSIRWKRFFFYLGVTIIIVAGIVDIITF